jgi:hypothetical protein
MVLEAEMLLADGSCATVDVSWGDGILVLSHGSLLE